MENRPCLAFKLNLNRRPCKVFFFNSLANVGKQKRARYLSFTLKRPVKVAFFLVVFEKLRGHDDHARIRLPDHLPKVRNRIFFWSLRANVFLLHFKTVAVACVDVVVLV